MDGKEMYWEIMSSSDGKESKKNVMRAECNMPIEIREWRLVPFVGLFHKEDMVEVVDMEEDELKR